MNFVDFEASVLIPLIPVLLLVALLIGWSLIDMARKPVQNLPKWAWALIVLLAIPLGAIVYLIIGRTRGLKLRDEDLR